jgi:hypothetical protein
VLQYLNLHLVTEAGQWPPNPSLPPLKFPWQPSYSAAALETDNSRLTEPIRLAEEQITSRMSTVTTDQRDEDERVAINDALCGLADGSSARALGRNCRKIQRDKRPAHWRIFRRPTGVALAPPSTEVCNNACRPIAPRTPEAPNCTRLGWLERTVHATHSPLGRLASRIL